LVLFLSIKAKNLFFSNFSEITDLILFAGGFIGFFFKAFVNILFELVNLELKIPVEGNKSLDSPDKLFDKPLFAKGNSESSTQNVPESSPTETKATNSEYDNWDWEDLQDLKYQMEEHLERCDTNSQEYKELKSRIDEVEQAMERDLEETSETENEYYSQAESSKFNENKDFDHNEVSKSNDLGRPKSEKDLWKEDAKNFSSEQLEYELNRIDDMIETYESERVRVPAAEKEISKLESKKAVYLDALSEKGSKEPEPQYEGKGKGIDYSSLNKK
jgi:hypothetical protein